METTELCLVLQNCFSPEKIKKFLKGESVKGDPYEDAVEAILCDDEAGLEITHLLDRDSKSHRNKIKALSPRDLRNSLAFEFLEPGRTLGLILWALLRDDRIGTRSMAGELAKRFSTSTVQQEEISSLPQAEPVEPKLSELEREGDASLTEMEVQEKSLDEVISEFEDFDSEFDDEALSSIAEIEISDEEEDMEGLLADLGDDEMEELSLESEDIDLISESTEEVDEIDALVGIGETLEPEDEPLEEIIIDDLDVEEVALEEDIDSLIESLAEEEEQVDAEELDVSLKEPETVEETLIPTLTDEHFDEVDDFLSSIGEKTELEEEEMVLPEIEETIDTIESLPVEPKTDRVSLSGVEISISSLKRACERVFEEPVELVADENLTSEDKIVVVGKNCGVKVLHGPLYTIHPPEETHEDTGAPVSISPTSLQAALAKIYAENVELIPDPTLLGNGVVAFSGKQSGITVIKNSHITVSLPPWVNPQLAEEIQASLSKGRESDINLQIHDEIAVLEKRLAALEHQEVAPPEAGESIIEEKAISLDEIETEELEPIPESIPEVTVDDKASEDDIQAAIAAQEAAEEEDISLAEDIEEDELDSLILDTDTEEKTGASTEIADDDLDIENLLGDDDEETVVKDLDLTEELEEDEATAGEVQETSDESNGLGLDEIGEEELNLDDLDLDELSEDIELDEDETEEEIKTDSGEEIDLEDLDLDVLDELGDEDEVASEPQKVFGGEMILLLGGEEKHESDYHKVVEDLGGLVEWRGGLNDANEDEIAELVDKADMIMTLSSDAVSDPGILQATNYAQENNKRLFSHHSSNPLSVQKQLVKLVEEGKV